MNNFVIDMFLTGLMGGVIGSSVIIAGLYFHLRASYNQYHAAREDVMDLVVYKRLESEMSKLKHQFEVIIKEHEWIKSHEEFTKK